MASIENENAKKCTFCKKELNNIHHFRAKVLVESQGITKTFDIFQQDIMVSSWETATLEAYLGDEDKLKSELNEKFKDKICTLEYYKKAMEKTYCPLLLSLEVHGLKS